MISKRTYSIGFVRRNRFCEEKLIVFNVLVGFKTLFLLDYNLFER